MLKDCRTAEKPIPCKTRAARWTELLPAPRNHTQEEGEGSPHNLSRGRKVLPRL